MGVKGFVLALVLFVAVSTAAVGSAATGHRVFYLSVRTHQCLVRIAGAAKTVSVVPCSDPAHEMEVFAVGHGGWGHGSPPSASRGYALARSICLSAFQRITGHVMPRTEGWQAFWPDPGTETARYGDKIICNLRTWPNWQPLGAGWHVR
ncbi:MAG TPA: hypothetical protein VKT78_16150 [Fimbriimonadaceae bacterium]|nr:hypothetical protein [Fimbriimonadaceae bacterium]